MACVEEPCCYDLDAAAGPLEVDEQAWDGVSVWIGSVPSHGVCRVVGDGLAGAAGSRELSLEMRRSVSPRVSKMFRQDWRLTDELRDHLDAIGDGLALESVEDPRQPLATVSQPNAETGDSWCLVTFRKPADAASLLASGLQAWMSPDSGEPCPEIQLRRALSAAQARFEVVEAERRENARRDRVRLAVGRIFAWLQRHEESLDSLFHRIDKDSSGDFDEGEFRAAMLGIGLTFDNDTIQAIFSFMDTDGGGVVDTAEFSAFLLYAYKTNLARSSASVLLKLSLHFDKTQETLKDVFRRVGQEVSLEDNGPNSVVDVDELHEALVAINIDHSEEALRAVMEELDINSDGSLSLFELTARLGAYRKERRHQAATILHDCSTYLRKTGQSATRIFKKCNADGTGELDISELHDVLGRMGQKLSVDATAELMAELDIDGGGTVHVNEFLDKMRQAVNERAADAKRCEHFFLAADTDGSGYLDKEELATVASKMGLGEQVENSEFIEQVMLEIETIAAQKESKMDERHIDGSITKQEFLDWWFAIGSSYLDKPSYQSSINLNTPSQDEMARIFCSIDSDGSGAVDLNEVQEALMVQWPYMDLDGFRRAFNAADADGSGEVEQEEFMQLVKFAVWLNENRHRVQELQDTFTTRSVRDDEFWYAFQQLGFRGSDGDAKYLYDVECKRLGQDPRHKGLSFEQYVVWAVKYACVGATLTETVSEAQARRNAIMSKELSNAAGEYGDIHFVDLASIIIKGMRDNGGSKQESEPRSRFKSTVRTVVELSNLVKSSLSSCRARNDSFPNFQDTTVCRLTQMFVKEEFFSGQSIITQGEQDGTFYVLRRGKVDIILDDKRIGGMGYGHGFGEIGLLLGVNRTCTVRCVTPCEVFALERADYETLIASLPQEERVGPLSAVLDNFWRLMTNPHDGSRRQSVDYATYLKSHIRTSKTLTSNCNVEEFDEDEEREVAQSDWSEDCARYHLKVTESLNKSQYYSSMYQLVELWSEDFPLSYQSFLAWVFENICGWDTTHECYVFKPVDEVQAVGERFEKLKDDARAVQEAEKAAEKEALAAAEEKQARAAQMDRIGAQATRLAGAGKELKDQLATLDDEEAELRRRLASGSLSPQEESAARDRLDAIAAERAGLQAAMRNNQLQVKLTEIDGQLAALEDEEAALLRRLADGKLTPDEEAHIRARLSAIAVERDNLLQQRQMTLHAQRSAAADIEDQAFAAQLAAINRKLTSLEEEEAALLRRLAAGDLTAEEEALVRSRLAEIAEERNNLLNERRKVRAARAATMAATLEAHAADELAVLGHKLATLDDEEAELLRRLAAGDLTAQDEATIRARLAAIERERSMLRAQLLRAQLSSRIPILEGQLSALDDEQNELMRRLAAGGLTPQEESEIRARLAAIAAERAELLEAQEAAIKGLLDTDLLSEAEAAALTAKLYSLERAQVGRKLAALDDEEQELLRRLANGALTPQEEAEMRARLAEIAAERAELYAQSKVSNGKRLASLDNEEAELRRRLAIGDLTPEEEELIRQRLKQISAEREALVGQRDDVEAQRHLAEQQLAVALEAAAECSSPVQVQRSLDEDWHDPFSEFLYSEEYPRAAQTSTTGNPRVRAGWDPLNSSQLLWDTPGKATRRLQYHHHHQQDRQTAEHLPPLRQTISHGAEHTSSRNQVDGGEKNGRLEGRVSAPPVLLSGRPNTRLNVREATTAARASVGSMSETVWTLPSIHLRHSRKSVSRPALVLFDARGVQRTRLPELPSVSPRASISNKAGHERGSIGKQSTPNRRRRRLQLHESPIKVQLRE